MLRGAMYMRGGAAIAWTKDERRSGNADPVVADLGMYAREHASSSSLSLEVSDCVAQFVGESGTLGEIAGASTGARNAPAPARRPRDEMSRTSRATTDADEDGEVFMSATAADPSEAPPRVPTTANHQHPLSVHRVGSAGGYASLELEDYLCTCLYCPRAVAIQRAYQLYGFALDHPQSEALLRVLRACANYDETVVEIDPLLVLHAEKLLEELQLGENEAFRLLAASHFKRSG